MSSYTVIQPAVSHWCLQFKCNQLNWKYWLFQLPMQPAWLHSVLLSAIYSELCIVSTWVTTIYNHIRDPSPVSESQIRRTQTHTHTRTGLHDVSRRSRRADGESLDDMIGIDHMYCFSCSLISTAHLSRRGPSFDLSFQQKFQQNMKIGCLGFHKIYKWKKSTEGSTLLMLGF